MGGTQWEAEARKRRKEGRGRKRRREKRTVKKKVDERGLRDYAEGGRLEQKDKVRLAEKRQAQPSFELYS